MLIEYKVCTDYTPTESPVVRDALIKQSHTAMFNILIEQSHK